MSEFTYYHNPRCSKSREGLRVIEQRNVSLKVVNYLKDPLDQQAILSLLHKLKVPYTSFIREKEAQALNLYTEDNTLTEWADAIVQHPSILQRPILETATDAQIGRPPESLTQLLK